MASVDRGLTEGAVARVLLAPVKLVLGLALTLVGLLLVAWAVDLLCVAHFWPNRVGGLRYLLAEELAVGVAIVARQGGEPSMLPRAANGIFGLLFEVTGLLEMGYRFAEPQRLSIPNTVVRAAWVARHEALETLMLGTQLVGLRASILARFIPLIALLQLVGVLEGLSRRAARRARASRESAYLYHRAKYGQLVTLMLGSAVLILWPTRLAWVPCGAGFATLAAVLPAARWSFYKKAI